MSVYGDHEETIAPGAFRDLPDGPVPLRWGPDLDGPIIGYVTLSRLDDGTLLVSAADRPEDPDDDLVGVGTALQETGRPRRPARPEPIIDLIERSSLGTPAAKALRDSVQDSKIADVMQRLRRAEHDTPDEQPPLPR